MQEMIEAGDSVIIIWSTGAGEPATLLRAPRGEGDLWQLKRTNGDVIALNPYNQNFSYLLKRNV
jgi:hypothetical protein